MSYHDEDLDWVLKTPERHAALRSISRELCKEIESGILVDANAKLTRILETVFARGVDWGSVPREVRERSDRQWSSSSVHLNPIAQSKRRRMSQYDLPSRQLQASCLFEILVGRDSTRRGSKATSEGLVLIMRPAVPGMPTSKTRDQWFYNYSDGITGLGNPTILPLAKLGLYEQPIDLQHGWKVTYMTEWGFELFSTGETSLPEDRVPGGSSTYEEYAELIDCDRKELFLRVGRKIGLIKGIATTENLEEDVPGLRIG